MCRRTSKAWIASWRGAILPNNCVVAGKKLGERADRCRVANDRNGALVTARMSRVQGMLDIVTGRAGQPKVYGRQGGIRESAAHGPA